jgi:hypothetical protein
VRGKGAASGLYRWAETPEVRGLKIQRSHSGQNSFTENSSDVPPQDALVIVEGFRAHSRSFGCFKPSVKVLVQRDLGPFHIAAQVTLSQFSCEIGLASRTVPWIVRL